MQVVDASVVVEVLIGGASDVSFDGEVLRDSWVPQHLDAEVGHSLRRLERTDGLATSLATSALDDLARLPLRRAPLAPLLERAWEPRANVSFHDALYVALAERFDVPLLTLDERLARAPGPRCAIEVP